MERNGLAASTSKLLLFQTKIRFLGHHIYQGTIKPIQRALIFAEKFPDEIKDRKQLQRFLGCLNYVSDFFPNLRQICAPLYNRLRKNPKPWSEQHTQIIQQAKIKVQSLPCLGIPHPDAFMMVETDASDIGYGGILKQKLGKKNVQIVHFHFGLWHGPQQKYSTIKKQILAIVLCVSKFQMIYLSKNSYYVLTANLPTKFCKKMFKIWCQNKSLLAGKQFYLHLILILNLSKELIMLFRIFLQENSCKIRVTQIFLCRNKYEFEQTQEGQRQSHSTSWRLSAPCPHKKSIYSFSTNTISSITLQKCYHKPILLKYG